MDPARPPASRQVLAIAPHYLIATDDSFLIRTRNRTVSLRGATFFEVLPHLLPLLDGSRSTPEILSLLKETCGERKVRAVLDAMSGRGLIEARDVGAGAASDAERWGSIVRYMSNPAADGSEALRRIRAARVLVVAPVEEGKAVCRLLRRSGVAEVHTMSIEDVRDRTAEDWAELLRPLQLAIFISRQPVSLNAALEPVNAGALEAGTPWVNVAFLSDHAIQVGPSFVPHFTGCQQCLVDVFRRSTLALELYPPFAACLADGGGYAGRNNSDLAASLAATEGLRVLGGLKDAVGFNRILTLDLKEFRTTESPANRIPRCSACGPARDLPRMRVWS